MLAFQGLGKIKCPKSMYGNRRYTEINDLSIFKMIILLSDNNKQMERKTQQYRINCMGRAEVCCHGSNPASHILTTIESSTI